MNVGTTAVENLLRVARDEAAAGTAFVAFIGDGSPPQLVAVPAAGTPEALSPEELTLLVRQAAADPEFPHARVFVRSVQSVQTGRPLTLAVAPLRDGAGRSMIGVVAEPDRGFERAELEVLERLADRLLRHLHVVRQLNVARAPEAEPQAPADDPRGVQGRDVASEGSTALGPAGAPEAIGSPREAIGSPREAIGPIGSLRRAIAVPAFASWREPEPTEPPQVPEEPSATNWWAEPDPRTGLCSLGQFFSRAGRMLAHDDRTTGALALVVVEVPDARTTANAAYALRAQLRFSDPVTRIDRDLLAIAILLLPAGPGDVVEQRLAAAVRSALEQPGPVRTVHVVAELGSRRDVDDLLREAVSRLPGRQAGGGGAPWRGAGGSAARLPIP